MARLKSTALERITWVPGEDIEPVEFRCHPYGIVQEVALEERVEGMRKPMAQLTAAENVALVLDTLVPLVVEWSGVDGDDDQPLPVNEVTVRRVLETQPGARDLLWNELVMAYRRRRVPRKNASWRGLDGSPRREANGTPAGNGTGTGQAAETTTAASAEAAAGSPG